MKIKVGQLASEKRVSRFVLGLDQPLTPDNGSVLGRLYDRLTRTSRDEHEDPFGTGYRLGVRDAYQALQKELK